MRQHDSDAQLSICGSESYMELEELGEGVPVYSRPEGWDHRGQSLVTKSIN